MSRFEDLARLKKQAARIPSLKLDNDFLLYPDGDAAIECYSNLGNPEADWLEDVELAANVSSLLNAAPWLLRIAEAFQPGDAMLLSRVAIIIGQSAWQEKYAKEYEMLRRLQAAAEELER